MDNLQGINLELRKFGTGVIIDIHVLHPSPHAKVIDLRQFSHH